MSWFGTYHSSDSLDQGVILSNFPLPDLETIKYPIEGEQVEQEFTPYDVIVLTQTCDLAQNKVDRIYLCPVYTLEEYFIANSEHAASPRAVKSEYERLKQGQYVNRFLLNKCSSNSAGRFSGKFLVVFFDKTVVVSRDYVETFLAKSRRKRFPSLKAPYRESLAQHYGRYFMRVGNPVDYPRKDDIDISALVANA